MNAFLIPSQAPGGTGGFEYTYNDYDIASGVTYYYWLEDVDLSGTVTRHDPVQVTAGNAPNAVTLTALQGSSAASALPLVALGFALVAGLGVVAVRRRR
jgi:LPXTG-motif cell wall-anchored protein